MPARGYARAPRVVLMARTRTGYGRGFAGCRRSTLWADQRKASRCLMIDAPATVVLEAAGAVTPPEKRTIPKAGSEGDPRRPVHSVERPAGASAPRSKDPPTSTSAPIA